MNTITSTYPKNKLAYLSLDIVCSEKRTDVRREISGHNLGQMEAIIYSTFMKSTRSNPNGQVELKGNTKKAAVSASVTNSREVSIRLKWRCKILIQIIEHGNYRLSPTLNDLI